MRYSLYVRRLAAVISILALITSVCWIFAVALRAYSRARSLDKIEENGGWVAYAHFKETAGGMGSDSSGTPDPPGTRFLRWILGDAYFVEVVGVDYTLRKAGTSPVLDALNLTVLHAFPEIEFLDLEACGVTDEDLRGLRRLKRLEVLHLGWNPITSEGLMYLETMPFLKELDLQYTNVTDEGLKHLRSLSSLEHCVLSHTSVTDDGLRLLSTLKNLRRIELSSTDVTGTAFQELSCSLQDVDLTNSAATDATVNPLAELADLRTLSLRGTRVTDRVCSLLSSRELREVDLRWTFVTKEGVAELRQKLPKATISFGPRVSDEDVEQIKSLLSNASGGSKPILGFARIGEHQVEVWTGANRATLEGEGEIFTLSKESGEWVIVEVCGWVS